ncbi:chitin synthase [Synchytrium microbalum]|uniref:chitin synthase n=1 Tax=Synchytrium microbalum TaxID=1806994 RepID=A0A507CEM7_9FUNG|nr:chitin synthase [Synchytrium microbalum]TPX36035.1 chitin synthase [Synchytrium microbalum]
MVYDASPFHHEDESTFYSNDNQSLKTPPRAMQHDTLDNKYPMQPIIDSDNPFASHFAERKRQKNVGSNNPSRTISLRRGANRSMNRPNRAPSMRRVQPMLRGEDEPPPLARAGATSSRKNNDGLDAGATLSRKTPIMKRKQVTWWTHLSLLATCCFPPSFLMVLGLRNEPIRQAWREKVALCLVIFLLCASVGFLTFFLRALLCNGLGDIDGLSLFNQTYIWPKPLANLAGVLIINTYVYDYDKVYAVLGAYYGFTDEWRGADISRMFPPGSDSCVRFFPGNYNCSIPGPHGGPSIPAAGQQCPSLSSLSRVKPAYRLMMSWDDLYQTKADPHRLTAFDGAIVNLTAYSIDPYGGFANGLSQATARLAVAPGRDMTKSAYSNEDSLDTFACMRQRYRVASLDSDTAGCFFSFVIFILILVTVGTLLAVRFAMALVFYWCISGRLTRQVNPGVKTDRKFASRFTSRGADRFEFKANPSGLDDEQGEPPVIMFVTAYSEEELALQLSLSALVDSDYPDGRKLLFVVCDGVVTGSGNTKSTPEMVLQHIQLEESFGIPNHQSYLAIAEGARQLNMAKVFGGWYKNNIGHYVPTIVVIKTGAPFERSDPKSGNRGKRDSQLILMNFLSRAVLDDRMTPLDYELYWKIEALTGRQPDSFELIMMVDADTRVNADSMAHMANAMRNDPQIIGLCGETRIANKRTSWVTLIQVFEYYISHHLGKGFESVFGGVTCLPGCFCMYRIKAPKGEQGYWVPLLINPDIVEEYSENIVDTLHKKNLLLLGEDRFLTTLMLRNFPHRKTVFLPQAICHTTVPDTFRVLLSQRRRWINSTIHNLMELMLVKDLCGIFCFSMQFVVMLELLGTLVLPAAVVFTVLLIVNTIITSKPDWFTLAMFMGVLVLPAILIFITTRKMVYLFYMVFYLMAIPIWNLILPLYAWWHFDDFRWGETRKAHGDKATGHDEDEGEFDSSKIVLMRLSEWEKERRDRLTATGKPITRVINPQYNSSHAGMAPSEAALAPGYRSQPGALKSALRINTPATTTYSAYSSTTASSSTMTMPPTTAMPMTHITYAPPPRVTPTVAAPPLPTPTSVYREHDRSSGGVRDSVYANELERMLDASPSSPVMTAPVRSTSNSNSSSSSSSNIPAHVALPPPTRVWNAGGVTMNTMDSAQSKASWESRNDGDLMSPSGISGWESLERMLQQQ